MTKRIETLTYGIINNVDRSILKLNKFLEPYGYTFEAVSLHDLELKFSEVFGISRHFQPNQMIVKSITQTLDKQPNTISELFDEALKKYFTLNQYSNRSKQEPPDHEVYLLKVIKSTYTVEEESYTLIGESATAESRLVLFTQQLLRKLRLFKKGQIDFQGYFSIFKDNRRVISLYKTINKPIYSSTKYTITNGDLSSLSKLLNDDLKIPNWLGLGIESFELAYETTEKKVRFVLLMIALESIFNRSNNTPIRHVIARHTALLITESKKEFDEIFRETKSLYDTRCNIVHGISKQKELARLKEKLPDHLVKLEELTRKVILKCLWLKNIQDKEKLFDYLNKKGF